ncbi:CRISPR-associated helicase Cas3' [Anaerosalibacter bizertensis]|uniref:CRISPR-associated helicase Cas3' n=1 Tax=Anaerosalibacter bizertensis TaxID=932217 RepID=UPI0035172076
MKYYSHPGKLMIEHLTEVRDISIEQVPCEYEEAYQIVSLCHDFGKYTTYFQGYLKNKKKSKLSNHGFISAVFGGYIGLKRYGEGNILPLIIYNTILHHHGNLESFSTNLPNKFKDISRINFPMKVVEKIDIGYKQIEDMKKNMKFIKPDMENLNFLEEFEQFILEENVIENTLAKLRKLDLLSVRSLKSEQNYFVHQILYSALISADKISASNTLIPKEMYADYETLNTIRNDKFGKPTNAINQIRTEIFDKVLENIEQNYDKSNILSITAPTGTGKTVTGFFAALKLNEMLGGDRKIIYSLPFTSIIEQNYDVLFDIFKGMDSFEKNYSSYIIKHHNLSTVEYESEYRDYTKTEAELLIENWSSGVVVTTFVQLLETLVGTRNRMIKKFNSIKGSIIILDEIQAIDIKYFKLVDYILRKACEYLDVNIIIMTATKPLILTDALELLDDSEKYYRSFQRTRLLPRLENFTVDEFVNEIIENLDDKSYMIVCNTIRQSLEVYRKLRDTDRKVYYLSTNILPIHRSERIKEIEEQLRCNENIILVSTQVVEAGVDLDFDVVIRDIGPIDSVIQCAGRCNRNNRNEVGDVYIYSIVDETGKNFGNYVYGNTLVSISKEILQGKEAINEEEYFKLINEYFNQIKQNKSQDMSRKFIESIEILDFSEGEYSINRFSLIQNNPGYIDVFFIYDNRAEKAYENYLKLSGIENINKKRELYLDIQRDLKDYTLSIPSKYFRSFTADRGMIFLPKEGIEQFYDDEIGFKRDEEDECMIF